MECECEEKISVIVFALALTLTLIFVQWVGQLSNFLSASLLRFEKLTPGSLKNDFEAIKAALKPD